ncbi:TSUP family transporter [Helicobacter suis]|uniref:TSUP family transporter n=1 Tax=Helicobacter suis TaxID=104628 RepID=UPI0013D00247|nr:TSUP family transporter [Helicobacter suis]
MDFPWYVLILSFIIAFCAGLVDSIAGGGGLITVPSLLALAIPPHMALATNKLQSSFGSFMATFNFFLKGLVSFKELALGVLCIGIGAGAGSLLILHLKADILRVLIPIFLSAIFIYTLLAPKVGQEDRHARLKPPLFYSIFGFGIGFYDGFFGPGTGSFLTFSMVALLGLNMKKAVVHTKVLNFTANFVSLFVFLLGGHVIWSIGLLMGLGQMLGAWVGSNLVVSKEIKFIRKVFLCVVGATILKLIWDLLH